ncbi:MAG: hypothetical protein WKG07_10025 [Hymenobacter sp.]
MAYTLVTLIQQLNQRLQAANSPEKIVVIGSQHGRADCPLRPGLHGAQQSAA